MKTFLLIKLILISALVIQPIFAADLGANIKSKFLASSLFPVFELGYIDQNVDDPDKANKTGQSFGLGLGLRHEINKNILSTALLFEFHDLEGKQGTQTEEVYNVGSIFYLGIHRRFGDKHKFEDGLNLRARVGEGIDYSYKGRNNYEFIASVGPEFKYITTIKEKEVRLALGGYYDIGVVGQKVWTVIFRVEGYYEFMSWFK